MLLKELWFVFNTVGARCYRDKVHDLKESRVRPRFIHESEWPLWLAYWKTQDAEDLADQNKKNRARADRSSSGEDEDYSKHHLGTQSQATRDLNAVS